MKYFISSLMVIFVILLVLFFKALDQQKESSPISSANSTEVSSNNIKEEPPQDEPGKYAYNPDTKIIFDGRPLIDELGSKDGNFYLGMLLTDAEQLLSSVGISQDKGEVYTSDERSTYIVIDTQDFTLEFDNKNKQLRSIKVVNRYPTSKGLTHEKDLAFSTMEQLYGNLYTHTWSPMSDYYEYKLDSQYMQITIKQDSMNLWTVYDEQYLIDFPKISQEELDAYWDEADHKIAAMLTTLVDEPGGDWGKLHIGMSLQEAIDQVKTMNLDYEQETDDLASSEGYVLDTIMTDDFILTFMDKSLVLVSVYGNYPTSKSLKFDEENMKSKMESAYGTVYEHEFEKPYDYYTYEYDEQFLVIMLEDDHLAGWMVFDNKMLGY